MRFGKRAVGALAVVAVVPGAFAVGSAVAGSGTPADKMVAAGSTTKVLEDPAPVTILTGTMKTSKPTDVMIQTTLECSILTSLTTDNENKSSSAMNQVRVWAEVDGKVVALQQTSSPPQDPTAAGGDADKVTFCERTYQRSVENQEQLDLLGEVDSEQDYIDTKSAHGFNWVQMNLGSGLHTIAIKAQFTKSETGAGTTSAYIGNRSLIVEPTKMANDAVIGEAGTS